MLMGNIKQKILILTISNLIIGLIEFIFNIYLNEIFGAEGMGIISLVMPINCVFLSFMTEGVVITMSKISARHLHEMNTDAMSQTVKISTCASFIWALILSILVCACAGYIADHFLKDSSLVFPIIAGCPLMILMSLSNILKGHFLGLAKIKIPAAINICEKLLRFPILYCLIFFCLNKTAFPPVTLVFICFAIGEMQSVLLLSIYYKIQRTPIKTKTPIDFKKIRAILKPLIKGAIPICLTQSTFEFVNALSSIIVKSRLCSIGYTPSQSLSLLGKYRGLVFPLMMYPMILVGSMGSIIIPKISTMIFSGKTKYAGILMRKAILMSLLIGFATAFIFFLFADKMGALFYGRDDLALMIKLSGFLAPLLYVTTTTSNLLISLGFEGKSFKNSLLQQILLLILLVILTGIPSLNIYGYLLSAAISHLVLLFTNAFALKKSLLEL